MSLNIFSCTSMTSLLDPDVFETDIAIVTNCNTRPTSDLCENGCPYGDRHIALQADEIYSLCMEFITLCVRSRSQIVD